jgi:hypothetical protein
MAGVEPNPGPCQSIKLGCLNAGGANEKIAFIADLITDQQLDMLAISEM